LIASIVEAYKLTTLLKKAGELQMHMKFQDKEMTMRKAKRVKNLSAKKSTI